MAIRIPIAITLILALGINCSAVFAQTGTDYACEVLLKGVRLGSSREQAVKTASYIKNNFPDWVHYLPNCPLTVQAIRDNPQDWAPDSGLFKCYHLGATASYRSTKGYRSSPKSPLHGQQCTYDAGGSLITSGPGAGTPDFFKEPLAAHMTNDVMPFLFLPLTEYFAVWTPDRGEIEMPLGRLTDTGWDLVKGQSYEITARGIVQWGAEGSRSDPDGSPNVAESLTGLLLAPPPAPEFRTGALVGIGLPANGDATQPFLIGKHYVGTALINGRLYLFINDGFVDNNKGSFFVSIRKTL